MKCRTIQNSWLETARPQRLTIKTKQNSWLGTARPQRLTIKRHETILVEFLRSEISLIHLYRC